MINRYAKGRRKEWRIVNHFKAKGWISFRSAGSHSPIDVVAINTTAKEIKLIQSKAGKLSKPARDALLQELSLYDGEYVVKGELW